MRRRYVLPVLTVLVLVVGELDLVQHYRIAVGGTLALCIARALPVALCRYRPRLAAALLLPAITATALAGPPVSSAEAWPWAITSVLAVIPVAALLGARCPRWLAAAFWLALTAAGAALHYAYPERGGFASIVLMGVCAAAALLLADAVRGRAAATAALAEQRQVSEVERARRALLEERTRIARELHDVVAHHMSVIAVQSDSAPYRLDLDPAAAEEFGSIAGSARRSLAEMRRLLEVLRNEEALPDRGPQPGLDGLPQLVQNATAAGVSARLTVQAGDVPDGVGLTAYRIVQEALSNVVRHAPGAAATVEVARLDGQLSVRVHNGPSATEAVVEPGGGHGLVGMRERVAVHRGTLRVGPDEPGGFLVEATLPIE